jgi:hypothetical protein
MAATLALTLATCLEAQEGYGGEASHGAGHGHHFYRNEIGISLNDTYEDSASEHFFTLGAEWQYRFNELIGIAPAVEYVSDLDAWISIVPLTYHMGAWKLLAGPGWEHVARREVERSGHQEIAPPVIKEQNENLFLFRVGVSYSFHLGGNFLLSPSLAFDWVEEEDDWEWAAVFGFTLGYGF